MTMRPQFQRRATVTVSRQGSPVLVVREELQIEFGLVRSTAGNTDPSFVEIYNLSDASRSLIDRSGDHVRVEAGYQNSVLGLVGEGNIRRANHLREGALWITTLSLGSSDQARQATFVRSYKRVLLETIVRDAAAAMKLSVDDLSQHLIPRETLQDWSHSGYAREVLDALLLPRHVVWYEMEGQLRFRLGGSPTRRPARIISEATGMIGSPKPESDETTNLLGAGGEVPPRGDVRVQVQLDPLLDLDQEVEIQSQSVNGRYSVVVRKHVGSTRTGDWMTEVLCQGLTN